METTKIASLMAEHGDARLLPLAIAAAEAVRLNYVRWEDFNGAEPAAIAEVWKRRAEEQLGVQT